MQRRDKDDIDRLGNTMLLYERNKKIQYSVDTGFTEENNVRRYRCCACPVDKLSLPSVNAIHTADLKRLS